MKPYPVQPRDRIFVKHYGFLSFARNISKNIIKNLSSKYSQKLLDHAKQSATDALKTASERAIKKTGVLIGNKIGNKFTRVSKTLPQNNSETNEEEILTERYISRRKTENYWWSKINIIIYNLIMEHQKIVILLDDTTNEPSIFKTRNWVEINDEWRGTYNVNNDIKFKTSMIRWNLYDYNDAYINTTAAAAPLNNTSKKVILKNCAPVANCISEIINR